MKTMLASGLDHSKRRDFFCYTFHTSCPRIVAGTWYHCSPVFHSKANSTDAHFFKSSPKQSRIEVLSAIPNLWNMNISWDKVGVTLVWTNLQEKMTYHHYHKQTLQNKNAQKIEASHTHFGIAMQEVVPLLAFSQQPGIDISHKHVLMQHWTMLEYIV